MFKEEFMKIAIEQAKIAFKKGDVPVGCVIVRDDKILAKGYNKKEKKKITTRHAEIETIEKASKKLGDWRLNNCDMYVTLEPCCMCAGAILNSRIKNVYIGAMETKFGCCGSAYNLLQDEKFTTHANVSTGHMEQECVLLLQQFFKERRNTVDKNKIHRYTRGE